MLLDESGDWTAHGALPLALLAALILAPWRSLRCCIIEALAPACARMHQISPWRPLSPGAGRLAHAAPEQGGERQLKRGSFFMAQRFL